MSTTQDSAAAAAGTVVEPYLFFGGRCKEAIDFYCAVAGAQAGTVMLYNQSPEPMPPGMIPPGFEDKVMHATFRIGATTIMASDGNEEGAHFNGFSLTISVPTEAEARRVFDGLSEGGVVKMPLTKTFYSPCFGMLTDRFGLGWMIIVPGDLPN